MAGLLSWLGERAKDAGRILGTVGDVIVPGDQSSWHRPAAPAPRPQQPVNIAPPRPVNVQPGRSVVFNQQPRSITQPSIPSFQQMSQEVVNKARQTSANLPNLAAPKPVQPNPVQQWYDKTALKTGVENIRDFFDANTAADIAKRQAAGQPADYREQQIKLYKDTNGAQGSLRPYQNIGAVVAGNTARYVNTLAAASKELQDTIAIGTLQAVGANGLANKIMDENYKFKQQMYQPNSGLLGQGTIFNNPEEFGNLSAPELTKRVALNTVGTGLEIIPFSKGAGLAGTAGYQALSKGGQIAARTAAGAAENALQDIAEQQFTYDKWRPEQTLFAAGAGSVMPNVGPVVSKIKGAVQSKIGGNLPQINFAQRANAAAGPPTGPTGPTALPTPARIAYDLNPNRSGSTGRFIPKDINDPTLPDPSLSKQFIETDAARAEIGKQIEALQNAGAAEKEWQPLLKEFNKKTKQIFDMQDAWTAKRAALIEAEKANIPANTPQYKAITDTLETRMQQVKSLRAQGLSDNHPTMKSLFKDMENLQDQQMKMNAAYKPPKFPDRIAQDVPESAMRPKAPKGQEALFNEARKYKSADEFVKVHGEPIYHGTPYAAEINKSGFSNKNLGKTSGYKGVYGAGYTFTNDIERAKLYGKGIVEAYPNPNAKLFVTNDPVTDLFANPKIKNTEPTAITKTLKDMGYDGVEVNGPTGAKEIVIFDSKNLVTKNQLTDVWNKANAKAGAADNFRYHETSLDNLESIRKNGLQPNEGQYGKGVYFAPNPNESEISGSGLLLRSKLDNLKKYGYDEFPDEGWADKKVLAKDLEFSTDNGQTWKSLSEQGSTKQLIKDPKNFDNPQEFITANVASDGLKKPSSLGQVRKADTKGFNNAIDGVYAKTNPIDPGDLQKNELLVEFTIPKKNYNKVVVDDDFYEYIKDSGDNISDYVGQRAIDSGSIAYKGDVPGDMIKSIKNANGDVLFENPKAQGDSFYHVMFDKKNGYAQQLTDTWNKANKNFAPGTTNNIYQNVPKSALPPKIPTPGPNGPLPPGKGVSQFPETIKAAATTKPKLAKMLDSETYDVLPNKQSMENALKVINRDSRKALSDVLNESKPRTTELNAQGLILAERAQQRGDFDTAQQIFKAMRPGNTQNAQAIQVLSIWGRTSPEGVVKYAQKVVDDVNAIALEKGGKAKIVLTASEAKSLRTVAQQIQEMPEGRDKLIATQQMLNAIHAKIPASGRNKLQEALYYAQLLNPKTAIRNVFGNFGMLGSENLKDIAGTPGDILITGARRLLGQDAQRTTYMPDLIGQAKAMFKGGKEAFQEARAGVNLSGLEGQLQIGNVQPAFKGKIGTGLNKALQIELSVPDRAFYSARQFQSLKNQMRAAGVSKPTRKMLEIADYDGKYATFQDDSRAAKAFVSIKKGLNHITGAGEGEAGAGSFVLNYPKTPGNILARGIDYSPAGFVKSVVEMGKPLFTNQAFNQKAFVDNFSRALVGTTTLMGTGALLHNVGIITSKPSKDRDVNALEKQTGLGAYRINVSGLKRFIMSGFDTDAAKLQEGDTLVSYDWFQPAAIGISMGANIDETRGSDKGVYARFSKMLGSAGSSVAEGIQTISEQPIVKGLTKLTGYGDIPAGILDVTTDVPASFIPTFINQINQLVNNTARSTYDNNDFNVAINKIKAKIPFLSQTLNPQIDTLGQEGERYQGGTNNLVNVFLNPAFVSSYDPTTVEKEVQRLQQATGLTEQYPAIVQKTQDVNGQKIKLSGDQLMQMQQVQGDVTNAAFSRVMQSPQYNRLSDQDKVKMLQGIITDAKTVAKVKVLGQNMDNKTDWRVKKAVGGGELAAATPGTTGGTGKTPKDKYEEAKAKYEQELADGMISDVNKSGRLSQLTKLRVESNYSQDAGDLYGKSYKEIVSFVNSNKNGKALWEEIQKLDAEMVAAGYTSKIRDKYGRLKKTTTGTSKGGSRKAKVPKVPQTPASVMTAIRNIRAGKVRQIGAPAVPRYATKKARPPKMPRGVA